MLQKIEGIVTGIVKHNDRHNVVTLYTRSHGRMAFLSPVGKSRKGSMRNAVLSLMAVVSTNVNLKANKELYSLGSVEPLRLWHNTYANPAKSAMIFFLAEFCQRLLRQYPADERLWDFIVSSLETLDRLPSDEVANFHIAFLVGVLILTGISPAIGPLDVDDRFDMLTGEVLSPDHIDFLRRRRLLTARESAYLPLLLRINYRNMKAYRFSRSERNETLSLLLEYLSYHLPVGTDFKTLPVLSALFS